MYKILTILVVGLVVLGAANFAIAQDAKLATFQESAQILYDQIQSGNVTASITLQSTSNQEMRIPSDLESKIIEDEMIIAVALTNEEQCVLGVFDETCIIINVPTQKIEIEDAPTGIFTIQDTTKMIGDTIIGDLNQVFDTDAEFHSVYIHHRDEINQALNTTGTISGRGAVSAVYTMPPQDTNSLFQKMSAILLPKDIRDSGGFYDVATNLAKEDNSRMTFSVIPRGQDALFQLKLSANYPDEAKSLEKIQPLKYLKTDELKRSELFSDDFYPLNSLVNVVILSNDELQVSKVNSDLLRTTIIDGERFPDAANNGWFFDPESGTMIDGKYLFGNEFSVSSRDLTFELVEASVEIEEIEVAEPSVIDENVAIVIIIAIAAVGAAIFFLKGYRKNP